MKKIIYSIVAVFFFALFFFSGQAFAQTTQEDPVKKFNVTFPVAELGNCTDISSCKTYCQDQTHATECINFAKKKGFYREVKQEQKTAAVENAKKELGCESESSCRSICEKEENFDKCNSFAKKHKLGGGKVEDIKRKDIIEKAKQILGCDSPDSCKSFCEKEENRDKCSQLAKETGLRGGEIKVRVEGSNPEEMCKKTPSCKWENNRCECGFLNGQEKGKDDKTEFDKFCKENPEKCTDIEKFRREPGETETERDKIKPQEFEMRKPSEISPGMKPPMPIQGQKFSENPSGTNTFPAQKPFEQKTFEQQKPPQFKPPENKPQEGKPSEHRPPESKQPEFKPTEQRQPEQRPPEFKPPENRQQEQRPPEIRRESQPSSSVQGVSTEKSFFEKVVDYFLVR